MNKALRASPPGWFWFVAILLLLWNGFGVFAYLSSVMASSVDLARRYDEAELALFASTPFWATGAFAVAVFAGLAGSIGLLAKRSWARGMFVVSLIAAIIQQIWIFLLSDNLAIGGGQMIILPLLVDVVAIASIWLAGRGIDRGWLR